MILTASVLRRNGAFFYDSVSHNRRHRTVEEIENPVLDVPQARPVFVDFIAQQVRFRPPQFMPQFAQPFHPQKAGTMFRDG